MQMIRRRSYQDNTDRKKRLVANNQQYKNRFPYDQDDPYSKNLTNYTTIHHKKSNTCNIL